MVFVIFASDVLFLIPPKISPFSVFIEAFESKWLA
jgi:hypothetical protein